MKPWSDKKMKRLIICALTKHESDLFDDIMEHMDMNSDEERKTFSSLLEKLSYQRN